MSPTTVPASSSTQSTLPATKKPKEGVAELRPVSRGESPEFRPSVAWLADAGLVALFLGLTFLLGVFPLKDADIYWHLRTGDLIRQMGQVPRTDIFTFTREGIPWIDLHWIFQVAVSWLYERGGVVALNLAKCLVTCVAVLLLVTARRRDWPVWVMLVAWLPALLVLGGRMYVRPETLTLLYLSIFLAIVTRWDRHPYLAVVLPIVQVAWVNSQGLFVLGPIIVVFALIDAALHRGAFAPDRRRWWRIVGIASLSTLAACLVNPYGIAGALYPIQLAKTMGDPIFSRSVAELIPVPEFIRRAGIWNLPLQLHLGTMALGAISFLLPLLWLVGTRLFGARIPLNTELVAGKPGSTGKAKGQGKARSRKGERKKAAEINQPKVGADESGAGWRLSPFRLLLFAAFSLLSLQATRNTHQFAAVVGSVTAWNFGEWAAAIRRRRVALSALVPSPAPSSTATARAPRLAAAIAITAVLVWVGSGWFYEMTGERRTIGLGEDAFFFPHEAARFAGRPEMPDRFLGFHNGQASLFEYYHGPERKVYTDPRLEVAGADLFAAYQRLEGAIRDDQAGWQERLDRIGRPVILVDHEFNAAIGATLIRDPHWRCVWFDAIAADFVHDSATEAVRQHTVDFAARHFRPALDADSRDIAVLTASASALRTYLTARVPTGSDLDRPLVWLGLDETRRILKAEPDSADGWKLAGQIELFREPSPTSPRFGLPFDPVLDLPFVRATYALRHGWELSPSDFTTLWMLKGSYEQRLMYEAAQPVAEKLVSRYPINQTQASIQHETRSKLPEYQKKMGSSPPSNWRNLADLDRIVTAMLASGRAESAADQLEKGYPPERIPWEVLDRIATLRLHLGEPARARALWRKATSAPESAIALARVGSTYLVEGNFEAARLAYREALQAKPDLFEACYSLAVLEQDAGDATASYELAMKAVATARDDLSRTAARRIATGVAPFARTTQATTTDRPPADSRPAGPGRGSP